MQLKAGERPELDDGIRIARVGALAGMESQSLRRLPARVDRLLRPIRARQDEGA
jgi:hypothetical protein